MAQTRTAPKAVRSKTGKRQATPVQPEEQMTVGEYLDQMAGTERKPDTYVRTNIMLNERLIEEARELTGLQTKKEIVEEALKTLVRLRLRQRIRELEGIGWEGDLAEMRRGRDFVIND